MTEKNDLAGKAYWDKNWSMPLPELLDIKDASLANEINLRFHKLFSGLLGDMNVQGKRLLEVGCARSIWLPYFSAQHGLQVTGLDYSEDGCRQSELILAKAGVKGEVICADMFSPPLGLVESFDYVCSFGVIEHFSDSVAAITALSRFLKPGGVMITIIPNMRGSIGALQKLSDSDVFESHVALTSEELAASHSDSGLNISFCDYFISSNYYVVNSMHQRGRLRYLVLRLLNGLMGRTSMMVWQLERVLGYLPTSRLFSPYVICIAQKPA